MPSQFRCPAPQTVPQQIMADLAAITAFINPEAPHSHRCGQCGEVWTHCSADLAHCSDHEFDAAHHCPVCHSGPYRTKLLNAEVL